MHKCVAPRCNTLATRYFVATCYFVATRYFVATHYLLQRAILLQHIILLQHAILLQRAILLQNHFYLSYTTVQVWDHTTIYIWRVTITLAKRLQQIQCKRSNDLIADHHPKKTTNYSAQHKQRDSGKGDDFNRFGITD